VHVNVKKVWTYPLGKSLDDSSQGHRVDKDSLLDDSSQGHRVNKDNLLDDSSHGHRVNKDSLLATISVTDCLCTSSTRGGTVSAKGSFKTHNSIEGKTISGRWPQPIFFHLGRVTCACSN
jgi:hypothetical protein